MMPVKTVKNLHEIKCLQEQVRSAASDARKALTKLNADPMKSLYTLKLRAFGYDPLEEGRRLNLIEQLNQTFTNMASLAAAAHLLEWFPECEGRGLQLRLGTSRGRDIASIGSNLVEAEAFAAVRPTNNGKLRKDIDRLQKSNAKERYIFFYSPGYDAGRQCSLERPDTNIVVWALGKQEVM